VFFDTSIKHRLFNGSSNAMTSITAPLSRRRLDAVGKRHAASAFHRVKKAREAEPPANAGAASNADSD
jgi:hypothetical protein